MSTGTLPLTLEPLRLADREAAIEATVPLRHFRRLLEGALSEEGEVAVAIRFSRDPRGLARLEGTVSCGLSLTCQRCLEAVTVPLAAELDLVLLAREEDTERLNDEEDYLVIGEEPVALQDILEDELIISLPLVPTHTDCDSYRVEDEPAAEEQRENPFQVLAGLKGQLKSTE